jgi:hypothetical protein
VITITPLELSDPKLSKQQFVESKPRIVERRSTPETGSTPVGRPEEEKRSTEKEILIVGGSSAAGAAIGAAAGGV